MNSVFIIGNVGKEPHITEYDWGLGASFPLAISKMKKNKDGEKVKETTWVQCRCAGELARVIRDLVKKGQKLAIKGELKSYETEQDNHTQTVLYVGIGEFEILTPKEKKETNDLDFL